MAKKKALTNFELMEQEARRGFIKQERAQVSVMEILKDYSIEEPGPASISVVTGLGCLSLLAVTIAFSVDSTKTFNDVLMLGIWTFVLACLAASPTCVEWFKQYVLSPHRHAKSLSTRKVILEFQRSRIEDAKDAAIGRESKFAKDFENDRRISYDLHLIQERLTNIVTVEPDNDVYCHLLRQVEEKQKAMIEVKRQKTEYQAKVEKFVDACLEQVKLLEDPLSRLELVRETQQLLGQADAAIANVETSLAESLQLLGQGFQDMQRQIAQAYEESGVALAVDASDQGGSFNLKALEQIIEQHVPANLEKKVS